MSIQIIHHQAHLDCSRIAIIKHLFDLPRPILSGASFGNLHVSLPSQRLHFHKYFRNSISDVFVIHACRATRGTWYRLANFADQLLARLIHAHHRIFRIIRQVIDLQNILHRGYKGCAPLGRNFPVFAEVRFKFIFFKTRCTVMCDADGAMLSSTIFSASSLTVHRRCPSGASEQASAISLASNAPSNLTSLGGFSLGFRSSATSSPSSTKRFLRCSIVRLVTPSAVAVSPTVHAGPWGPASHSNKARARMNLLAFVLPRFVNASSSSRSWAVNVTRYLGAMATSSLGLSPL